jgi:hypothetical protein
VYSGDGHVAGVAHPDAVVASVPVAGVIRIPVEQIGTQDHVRTLLDEDVVIGADAVSSPLVISRGGT